MNVHQKRFGRWCFVVLFSTALILSHGFQDHQHQLASYLNGWQFNQIEEYWLVQSRDLIEAKQYGQALIFLNHLSERESSSPEVYQLKAIALASVGQFEVADVMYRKVIDMMPGDVTLLKDHGFVLIQLARYDEAVYQFQQALLLDSSRADVLAGMGRAYQLAGDSEQAVDFYSQSIKRDPMQPRVYVRLAEILHEVNLDTEALACLDIAQTIDPDHAELALSQKAVIEAELGRHEQAKEYVWQAYLMSPQSGEVNLRVARVYRTLNEPAMANLYYTRAIELGYTQSVAFVELGESYEHLMQFDKAVGAYQQAISRDPKNASIYFRLGLSLYRHGDHAAAFKEYENLKRMDWSMAATLLDFFVTND